MLSGYKSASEDTLAYTLRRHRNYGKRGNRFVSDRYSLQHKINDNTHAGSNQNNDPGNTVGYSSPLKISDNFLGQDPNNPLRNSRDKQNIHVPESVNCTGRRIVLFAKKSSINITKNKMVSIWKNVQTSFKKTNLCVYREF